MCDPIWQMTLRSSVMGFQSVKVTHLHLFYQDQKSRNQDLSLADYITAANLALFYSRLNSIGSSGCNLCLAERKCHIFNIYMYMRSHYVVLVLQPLQSGTHSHLAFATLPPPIPFVAFLKLTAASRPSAPPSDSPKCLRFCHWLTLHTTVLMLCRQVDVVQVQQMSACVGSDGLGTQGP